MLWVTGSLPRELLFNITIIEIDFIQHILKTVQRQQFVYDGGDKLKKLEVMMIKTMFVFRIRSLLKDT